MHGVGEQGELELSAAVAEQDEYQVDQRAGLEPDIETVVFEEVGMDNVERVGIAVAPVHE